MNKKIITFIIAFLVIVGIIVISLVALKNKDKDLVHSNNSSGNTSNVDEETGEQNRIKITFEDKELYVKLIDNESSRDLINMLPLTVDFDDYNHTEKIASLPRKLELNNNPGEYSVQVGDFAYYAPWGNLSIFYKEFKSSSSLQKLGEFETGIEELKNLKGKAVIEVVNEWNGGE